MQKGGDDEEEDDSQDRLQDIGDSTSFHARDGDVPVNKNRGDCFASAFLSVIYSFLSGFTVTGLNLCVATNSFVCHNS